MAHHNRTAGGALMKPAAIYRTFIFTLTAVLFASAPLTGQTLSANKLTAAPTLDGSDGDWQGVEAVTIPLNKSGNNVTVAVQSVRIKSGIFGDELFFFIQWDDATMDAQHKPFLWDSGAGKYVAGDQREDRFALQFGMEGEYTVDWLSGNSFKADTWHWKAARTNPLGLMHDKMTIIGLKPVKKAYKATARNGSVIYIQRPGDKGDKLYKTARYSSREKDIMPKYILADNPTGSVTDVKCSGVWKDGKWSLEVRRKLNTGNPDDIAFAEGMTVRAGLAVFDHTGDDNHVISDTFTFQL